MEKKYIAYMLTGVLTFTTLAPIGYADSLYGSNITFEQNQLSTGVPRVIVYDSLNNPNTLDLDVSGPTVPQSIAYYKDNQAIVRATEVGDAGLWKVVASNSKDADALTGGTFSGDATTQVAQVTLPNNLDPTQDHLYVVDKGGNLSDPISLVQDTAAPSATPTYAGGTISLNVTDDAGIAQINGVDYPTHPLSTTYPVPANTEEVTVTDVFGNSADIAIDTTVPQITRVAKKGTTVILTVESAGINLLKVSESDNLEDNGLHDFTQAEVTGTTIFLTTSADTLYVYDVAGHVAQIDLTAVVDTDGPAYEGPTYINGEIKLFVTDEVSGLKSINGSTQGYTDYPTTTQEYVVPANVSQVTLVDALDNQTTVSIDRTLPELSNIYIGDQGKTNLIATDASGITSVKYYVTGDDPQEVAIAGLPTQAPIEIPQNIQSIGVVDGFGNECQLNLANITIPTIQNIYKKDTNVYHIEASNITEIYYKEPAKHVLVANPHAHNTVEIPAGVTTIYVTDTNENEVAIDISGVVSTVSRAILSQDGMNMMVNISSTQQITSLTYLDENNNTVGTLNVANTQVSGLKEVPDNTTSFRINYQNGKCCDVVLDNDASAPIVTNLYKTGNKVNITLEDEAGLARYAYYVNGVEQSNAISNAPTSYKAEITAPEGVNRILIYDVFGDVTAVQVADNAVATTVETAAVSEDGDTAKVTISTDKPITSITYIDQNGVEHTQELPQNDGTFDGVIDNLNGATSITFVHQDGTTDTIALIEDDSEPEVSNAHVVDGKVVITVSDPAGVSEVRDDENNVIYTFNPPVTSGEVELPAGTTGIKVYDVLGNESTQAIEIDEEDIPTVENIYKTPDGTVNVDVTGISEIYYYGDDGEPVVIEIEGDITEGTTLGIPLPEGVGEIYFVYGEGVNQEEIVIPIGEQTPEVAKAVVRTNGNETKVALDSTKEIGTVVCYDEEGNEIPGGTLTGDDIDDIMSVPNGTAYVKVTYADGTKNTIELVEQEEATVGNAYKSSEDGTTTVTFENGAGINKITYELDGQTHEIDVSGETSKTVELPQGATNVTVIDMFDIPDVIDIPDNVPSVTDAQKDDEGNTIITTESSVTYTGEDGQSHTVEPDITGVVIIPVGAIDVQVNSVPPIGVDVSNITTTVDNVTMNEDGDKLAINVSGEKEITSITCYKEDGTVAGVIEIEGVINEDGTGINGVVDLPEEAAYIKINYEGGTSTKVTLKENESEPKASNVTSIDGKVSVTLEDNAGIDRIEYVDSKGVRHTIEVEGNPTKITKELDLPEDVTTIYVYDGFGGEMEVSVGEDAIDTTVTNATVSGDLATIGIESEKPISTITYVDSTGTKHTIDVHNDTEYNEIIDTAGATSITVNYQDGTKSVINLTQDEQGPIATNVCREYKTLSLTLADASGIARVVDENGINLAQNVEGEFEVSLRVAITNDLDKIYAYDRLGNQTVIELSNYPMVDNMQKKDDGTILIDTDGITEIYYYNEIGRKIVIDGNPSGTSEISVPEGVEKIYMADENGNEIEKSISDAQEISKTVVKGTEAIIEANPDKTLEEVVCYSESGRVLGTVLAQDIQQGKATVPEGTASIRMVYDDGSTNKVELSEYEPTQGGNVYQTDGDTMTVNVENSAGISKVTYEVGGVEHEINIGGDTSAQVELPADATNIKVIDGFGGEGTTITPPADMPSVTDIQKDGDGNIKVKSNKTLYYQDEQGREQEVQVDEDGNAVIPEGVGEVYTKTEEEPDVVINVSTVPTTVAKATLNEDGNKVALDLDTSKTLSQIICYDANGDEIPQGEVAVTGKVVNDVVDVPVGTASIKVVYTDGKTTNVTLKEDEGEPSACNTVQLENGKKLVTLEDAAGISTIVYVDANEVEHEITLEGNPTKVVQELDLPDGVTEIVVKDMFGTPTTVEVGEANMDTVIEDMATNRDGSGVFLNLASSKGIESLAYVDDYGVAHEIEIDENISEFKGSVDTVNANRIVVTYQDGTKSDIPLIVDTSVPTNDETVKDVQGKNIKTKLSDNRGIKSITYGEQVITQGLEGYPKNVVLQIKIVDQMGLSAGNRVSVMNDEGTTTIGITTDEESDDITVTNAVNTEETLSLRGGTVDTTEPTASVERGETTFVLTASDAESGILRVVGKETGNVIFEPEGCPINFVSGETLYPAGDDNAYVYNGVGLKTEVMLKVHEVRPPQVLWAYRNPEKNYIYVVAKGDVALDRIEDQDGQVRVDFKPEV